ncbi:MAG: DNA repair protein RadC [bacterium]|nr:DNA repair protein RadC [bacterium]
MKDGIKPHYLNHRKRLKEKYKKSGFGGWQDYEVLEFALSYAIPRKDLKPIAKELMTKFKTLNGVFDADIEELKEIKGISDHTAIFIRFLKDISARYLEKGICERDLVASPQAVYNYLKASLKGACDEEFKALFLNNRNSLLAIETIQRGTVNKSVVYPRKIVERGLYLHASSLIIAHNHPAGTLTPSEDDIRITKKIFESLKLVDILLLDHVIIAGNKYFSFKEEGLF